MYDPEEARCATITFLTGVIQGGASSPRIFTVFINALLEHLTCTGQALGISHGIEETEQFHKIAFMDDVSWTSPARCHTRVRVMEQHAAQLDQNGCS